MNAVLQGQGSGIRLQSARRLLLWSLLLAVIWLVVSAASSFAADSGQPTNSAAGTNGAGKSEAKGNDPVARPSQPAGAPLLGSAGASLLPTVDRLADVTVKPVHSSETTHSVASAETVLTPVLAAEPTAAKLISTLSAVPEGAVAGIEPVIALVPRTVDTVLDPGIALAPVVTETIEAITTPATATVGNVLADGTAALEPLIAPVAATVPLPLPSASQPVVPAPVAAEAVPAPDAQSPANNAGPVQTAHPTSRTVSAFEQFEMVYGTPQPNFGLKQPPALSVQSAPVDESPSASLAGVSGSASCGATSSFGSPAVAILDAFDLTYVPAFEGANGPSRHAPNHTNPNPGSSPD